MNYSECVNPKYERIDEDIIIFSDYIVKRNKSREYGVYVKKDYSNESFGEMLACGTTLQSAFDKAKLLQIGHNLCLYFKNID